MRDLASLPIVPVYCLPKFTRRLGEGRPFPIPEIFCLCGVRTPLVPLVFTLVWVLQYEKVPRWVHFWGPATGCCSVLEVARRRVSTHRRTARPTEIVLLTAPSLHIDPHRRAFTSPSPRPPSVFYHMDLQSVAQAVSSFLLAVRCKSQRWLKPVIAVLYLDSPMARFSPPPS